MRRQLRWPRAHYKRCAASNCGFCPSFRHAAQLRWPRAHCKRCAASNCGIRPSFRHAAQLRWPRAQYKHGTASTCKCIIFAPLFALCINLQLNYEGQEHITRMVQPMSVPTPPSPSHPAACTPNPNLNTIPSTPVGDFSSTHHHHHHHQQQQQQQQEQQQQRQQQEPSPLQQQQQQQQEGPGGVDMNIGVVGRESGSGKAGHVKEEGEEAGDKQRLKGGVEAGGGEMNEVLVWKSERTVLAAVRPVGGARPIELEVYSTKDPK